MTTVAALVAVLPSREASESLGVHPVAGTDTVSTASPGNLGPRGDDSSQRFSALIRHSSEVR